MTTCSTCRMSIPYNARVCPYCRDDRRAEVREEHEFDAAMFRFVVSAVLFGVPACLLWYRSPLGDEYRGAFWLILPVAGALGYRIVARYTVAAVLTALVLVVGFFWFR